MCGGATSCRVCRSSICATPQRHRGGWAPLMTAEGRPLRVAFFGHGEGGRIDGLSTYRRELGRSLRARGATVRFFAHHGDGDEAPVDARDVVWLRAVHFKTVTIPTLGTMATVRAALEEFRPDIVHISWSFSLFDGAIARAAHRV